MERPKACERKKTASDEPVVIGFFYGVNTCILKWLINVSKRIFCGCHLQFYCGNEHLSL